MPIWIQSGRVSGRDFLLDFFLHGAIGNVEIVARLQIDPEFRDMPK